MDAVTAEYNTVKEKHTATQTALASAEDLLQTLLTGLAGNSAQSSGGGGGYMGQIADARARLAQAAAEEEQLRVRLDMSRHELSDLEKRWKAVEREAGQGERDIKKMRTEVETLHKKVNATGWSAEREHASEEALRSAKHDAMRCTQVRGLPSRRRSARLIWGLQERDMVRSRLSQLDFNYTPPPGFDTRKVKGLVASLLALKPEDHGKSTALEIAAGGKLYNVVVEDERVGKDLLERGGIRKRVTLIPLNKIRAFKLSAEVCPSPLLSVSRHFIPAAPRTETAKRESPRAGQGATCALARRVSRRGRRGDRVCVQRHADLRRPSVRAGGDVRAERWRAQRHARRGRLRAERHDVRWRRTERVGGARARAGAPRGRGARCAGARDPRSARARGGGCAPWERRMEGAHARTTDQGARVAPVGGADRE